MLPKDIIFEISFYCDFLMKHRLKLINKSIYKVVKITYIPNNYIPLLNDDILKIYLHLKFLDITDTDDVNVTDDGIKHLDLYFLNVSGHCCEITDEGIKHMNNLRILYASYNTNITDEGIKNLNLEELAVACNDEITDNIQKDISFSLKESPFSILNRLNIPSPKSSLCNIKFSFNCKILLTSSIVDPQLNSHQLWHMLWHGNRCILVLTHNHCIYPLNYFYS